MSDLLNDLNDQQKQAVIHESGPLLIVAGAGTGKTTVITKKIAYLILEGKCRSEEILALTFTDKAAGEMEERVDRLLPYGYVDLWISTFHAFAERLLHEHGLEIGLPNDFKVLNTTEQWLLVRQNLDKFDLDYYRPLGNPAKFIHALLRHFSRAKDEAISPQEYLQYVEELKLNSDSADFIKSLITEDEAKNLSQAEKKELLAEEIIKQTEVANAYHVYQRLLLDNNAMDFGDLINYCLRLLQKRKNLLLRYRRQFKYILVDEFQDTNWAQYELVKLLAAPKNNITVVGDDDQSIYKFRGASISNILKFKDEYPQAKELYLTANYRSRQNLLDLSYGFIQLNNPYRLEIKLADKGNKLSKKLMAQQPGAGEMLHLHGRTLADEVKLAINKMIGLYNEGQDSHWSDFAVLVRANASAADFCYALEQARLPYQFVASKGLYGKQVVLDLLAYLKLLDNYHEGPAMHRVLSLPIWGVPQQDIVNFNYWASRKGWSLYEALKQQAQFANISAAARQAAEKILNLIARHTQLANGHKKTTEIIQAWLADSGYLKNLTVSETAPNREQLNYLNQFYKKIEAFERQAVSATLKDFLRLVELELEAGEEGDLNQNFEEAGPEAVKIMTVHAAKGLEFKYVFLPNLVDKRFPAIGRHEPIELPAQLVKDILPEGDIQLQEERRLFYVAMTRAKEGIYFSSADDYGGARAKKISRFLTELAATGLQLAAGVQAEPAAKIEKKKSSGGQPAAPRPSRFSFTQLKAFENCPYQYRFAHILKVPAKGKAQFSYGKTMHAALQKFFQEINARRDLQQADLFGARPNSKETVSWEELKKIYKQSFVDDWYKDQTEKQKYYDLGLKSLKAFYDNYLKARPQAEHLEYSFNIKIDEVNTLTGKIDRVDKIAGGLKIVDYKTGAAKGKLTAEDKEQLLLYRLATQAIWREPIKELAFYYLDNNQEISFLGEAEDLDRLRDKISDIIGQINQGDFSPRPGELCKYCDFNYICEYRKF